MTYQEEFDAALRCETKEEADAFVADNIARRFAELGQAETQAKSTLLANLGYMAGYCDSEVRDKIKLLFGAVHPVFGDLKPTPEQAFMLGTEAAARGLLAARCLAEKLNSASPTEASA